MRAGFFILPSLVAVLLCGGKVSMTDPLADIPDKDAMRLTTLVDLILDAQAKGTPVVNIGAYTDDDMVDAMRMIARLSYDGKAKRTNLKGGVP